VFADKLLHGVVPPDGGECWTACLSNMESEFLAWLRSRLPSHPQLKLGPTPRGPLRRGGAQVGDQILVTGALGGSMLGHHLDFEPRVREALLLHERYTLHAGMDVSDGLALDLSRLAAESGVGAALRLSDVPIAPAAEQWARHLADGSTPLDHALGDGEDFELLITAPPDEARRMLAAQPLRAPYGVSITAVGEIVAEPGLWQLEGEAGRHPLLPRGFMHRQE